MFKSFLIIALRNILKYKTTSFISILGLSVGMATTILLVTYLQFELSYDTFHEKHERIFRVFREEVGHDQRINLDSRIGHPVGQAIKDKAPQVESFTRLIRNWQSSVGFNGDYYIEDTHFADKSVFDIFSFNIIKGKKENILSEPYSIAISSSMAQKLFKNDEPIGRVLRYNQQKSKSGFDLKVVSVFKDLPENSSLKLNIILPFSLYKSIINDKSLLSYPHTHHTETFILSKNKEAFSETQKIVNNLHNEFIEYKGGDSYFFDIEPLKDIRLFSRTMEFRPDHRVNLIFIGCLTIFILVLGGINIISIRNAQSITRANEIGLRKVFGAQKYSLVLQFFTETLVISIISFILSLGLSEIFLPGFNNLIARDLVIPYFSNGTFFITVFLICLCFGICAGIYPMFYILRFDIIKTMRGINQKSKSILGSVMVALQCVISIFILIWAFTVNLEINKMINFNLGYNFNQMYYIETGAVNNKKRLMDFKNELKKNNIIETAGASSFFPYFSTSMQTSKSYNRNHELTFSLIGLWVDNSFLDTFNIPIMEGKNFTSNKPTSNTFIINRLAQEVWNLKIGDSIKLAGKEGHIIGIAENFYYQDPSTKPLEPTALINDLSKTAFLYVRLSKNSNETDFNNIRKLWKSFFPEVPFELKSVSTRLNTHHENIKKQTRVFVIGAVITLFLTFLGLFGLLLQVITYKYKEIAIRKSCGATIREIIFKLNKPFIILAVLASTISVPLAYYSIHIFLDMINYSIPFVFDYFGASLSVVIVFIVIIAGINFHITKAARTNPAKVLRNE